MFAKVALAQSSVRVFAALETTEDAGLAGAHQVICGSALLQGAPVKFIGLRFAALLVIVPACAGQAAA